MPREEATRQVHKAMPMEDSTGVCQKQGDGKTTIKQLAEDVVPETNTPLKSCLIWPTASQGDRATINECYIDKYF